MWVGRMYVVWIYRGNDIKGILGRILEYLLRAQVVNEPLGLPEHMSVCSNQKIVFSYQ